MSQSIVWPRVLAKASLLLGCVSGFAAAQVPDGFLNVRKFGATGDGAAKDTAAVQKAIDACSAGGGGTVYLAPGTYLCGSLHLKTGVCLWLDAGATIKGSPDHRDYDPYEKLDFKNEADRETTFFHHSLIWGEDVQRIGIAGSGTIDSNRQHRHGPKAVALKRCRFVDIKDIRILNAPNYAISLLGTDDVQIRGVTILNAYADGIDPDACRNVRISDCHIESVDDAIVPKASFSLGQRRSCENITVTNCYLSTVCNAFKLGTESGGDFKRIAVSNCVMTGLRGGYRPASGGIALESVDGSNIDGVVVSNITMVNVRAPIFIRLGNRGRDMKTPVPGTLRNVAISNIVATEASLSCTITGIPDHPVEGVSISDTRIVFKGSGPYRPSNQPVPENIKEYPDPDMFDALPTYGLYCRHVSGLSLSNIHLSAGPNFWRLVAENDNKTNWQTPGGAPSPSAPGRLGHAIVCDDVCGLDIDALRATPDDKGAAVLRFVNVRDALLRNCTAAKGTSVFLEATGNQSRGISLIGNVLTRAHKPVTLGEGAPTDAVTLAGNIQEKQNPAP